MGRLHNCKVWHTNLPRAVAGAKIIKLQSQSALFALSIDGFYKVVNTETSTQLHSCLHGAEMSLLSLEGRGIYPPFLPPSLLSPFFLSLFSSK